MSSVSRYVPLDRMCSGIRTGAAESTGIAQLDLFRIEASEQDLLLVPHRNRWPAASAGYLCFERECDIKVRVVGIPAALDLHRTQGHYVVFGKIIRSVPVEFGG
jgi:hypothetical protein